MNEVTKLDRKQVLSLLPEYSVLWFNDHPAEHKPWFVIAQNVNVPKYPEVDAIDNVFAPNNVTPVSDYEYITVLVLNETKELTPPSMKYLRQWNIALVAAYENGQTLPLLDCELSLYPNKHNSTMLYGTMPRRWTLTQINENNKYGLKPQTTYSFDLLYSRMQNHASLDLIPTALE